MNIPTLNEHMQEEDTVDRYFLEQADKLTYELRENFREIFAESPSDTDECKKWMMECISEVDYGEESYSDWASEDYGYILSNMEEERYEALRDI
jgi:hypothetical protein